MLLLLNCGSGSSAPSGLTTIETSPVPTRKELKFLDEWPARFVTGTTATLDDIAAQPDVPHQREPVADPHPTSEDVRIIVHGSTAALAAVVTKLMRIDALWVQVAFIPTEPSDVATIWGVSSDDWDYAMSAPARPTPLIRDDHGLVTLGTTTIAADGPMVGEVIVDSETLYSYDGGVGVGFNNGVTLSPTLGAPGLAAVQRKPLPAKGWRKWFTPQPQPTLLTGRALQAGGVDLLVTRDGVPHPRPVTSVTFYRHLRDGQFVRC